MKKYISIYIFMLAGINSFAQVSLSPYNVKFEGQSKNAQGSMPIGNGDIGANVWVDTTGILNILVSKTDAYSEIGRLLKIGKIEVKITPNILDAAEFTQTLKVEEGVILIHARKGSQIINLSCYIDANNPLINIGGNSTTPIQVEIKNQIWRTASTPLLGFERHSAYGVGFRDTPFNKEIDSVITFPNALMWVHHNKSSIWQLTLDNQNISEFNTIGKDPLLHQHFGALVMGDPFVQKNEQSLELKKPSNQFNFKVVVLKKQTENSSEWKNDIVQICTNLSKTSNQIRFDLHKKWWQSFWNQHYIIVKSTTEADTTFKVTQGYLLQRYMNACSGRGGMPIKFNGSIFTVPPDSTLVAKTETSLDADFRLWGANFWFQNTRIPYLAMYYAGDFQLMKPFFNMYIKALPLAKYRTKKYFNHDGAYFPETITPWGSYLNDNYGWDRKGKKDGVSENMYIRYLWQGSLELCKMMFDYYEFTDDKKVFTNEYIPFIKEIITFYSQHYKKDETGKINIQPAQALETYFEGVVNPAPDLAGLHSVLSKIKQHQRLISDDKFTTSCALLLNKIPDLPIIKEEDDSYVLSAGLNLGKKMNIESPELYAIFPYRIFGLGKPNISVAINSFKKRSDKAFNGWQQDPINAAYLGLTNEAKLMVSTNFLNKHIGSRFPAFWGPNYDWVPDQDHGNINMRALQNMLVHSEDNQILLMPAWPKDWEVQFKINVQGNKKIEGSYSQKKGVIIRNNTSNLPLKIMSSANKK